MTVYKTIASQDCARTGVVANSWLKERIENCNSGSIRNGWNPEDSCQTIAGEAAHNMLYHVSSDRAAANALTAAQTNASNVLCPGGGNAGSAR